MFTSIRTFYCLTARHLYRLQILTIFRPASASQVVYTHLLFAIHSRQTHFFLLFIFRVFLPLLCVLLFLYLAAVAFLLLAALLIVGGKTAFVTSESRMCGHFFFKRGLLRWDTLTSSSLPSSSPSSDSSLSSKNLDLVSPTSLEEDEQEGPASPSALLHFSCPLELPDPPQSPAGGGEGERSDGREQQ